METTQGVIFNVYPLGEYIEKETNEEKRVVLVGPKSSIAATKIVVRTLMDLNKFHHLARIQFWSENMLQSVDGEEGPTSYDILVFVIEYRDCKAFGMFIDMGAQALPIALWYNNTKDDELSISNLYRNERENGKFIKALTDDDIIDIFILINGTSKCYLSKFSELALYISGAASKYKISK